MNIGNKMFKKIWDYTLGKLKGWRTYLSAFAMAVVNCYDAVAQYMDWSKIFSDPTQLMLFNVGMGILILFFRWLANRNA